MVEIVSDDDFCLQNDDTIDSDDVIDDLLYGVLHDDEQQGVNNIEQNMLEAMDNEEDVNSLDHFFIGIWGDDNNPQSIDDD
mmetsp:Transcript_14809/g.14264  ORF Transcript_14809/g.14264 Transcript_14809/m.14264 type:complete len:81 (-) Transcript_14809:164-406(-)